MQSAFINKVNELLPKLMEVLFLNNCKNNIGRANNVSCSIHVMDQTYLSEEGALVDRTQILFLLYNSVILNFLIGVNMDFSFWY